MSATPPVYSQSLPRPINHYANVLTPDEWNTCQDLLRRPQWQFGGKTVTGGVGEPHWYMELANETFFTETVLQRIQTITKVPFFVSRIYANGQTYGMDGRYHQDDMRDHAWTFILYTTDITATEPHMLPHQVYLFGGQTEFSIPGAVADHVAGRRIVSIHPFPNTGVLFQSHMFHRGLSPHRYVTQLRTTVAFKLFEQVNTP